MRYVIAAATTRDAADVHALASHLNSVNLPHDAEEVRAILRHSEDSFSGAIEDPTKRQYVFVLRDEVEGVAVGTSMVIGQLGTRDAPYVFFDVNREERYSHTLDEHFVHDVLSIGFSYHGPTEIGGLVVDPSYRRVPERLGMLISYVRFLFIATNRPLFQYRVLAELMPPLADDGTSHLWEAVGRHFTGLTYRDADRLSKKNKEFIRGLFPRGDIYVSLLPPEARAVVGEVGPQTRGVAKMLHRIGFRYWNRVDPFDGGPHYIAPTDEISLVQRTRRRVVRRGDLDRGSARRLLLARQSAEPPFFEAVAALAHDHPDTPAELLVDRSALERLAAPDGETLSVLPLY